MKENFGRILCLLVCLLLLSVGVQAGNGGTLRHAFVFVVENGTPTWIRWSDVSVVKLLEDGQESEWQIGLRDSAEPLIVKHAFDYPDIAERLKDREP